MLERTPIIARADRPARARTDRRRRLRRRGEPTREEDRIRKEGWIGLALTPGRWPVLLGWTEDLDVRTSCRTLFRGTSYDEVEYELDGAELRF
ncbi:hypothetical protein [Methanopyrus kandleri]